jgi:hypothetical protein
MLLVSILLGFVPLISMLVAMLFIGILLVFVLLVGILLIVTRLIRVPRCVLITFTYKLLINSNLIYTAPTDLLHLHEQNLVAGWPTAMLHSPVFRFEVSEAGTLSNQTNWDLLKLFSG